MGANSSDSKKCKIFRNKANYLLPLKGVPGTANSLQDRRRTCLSIYEERMLYILWITNNVNSNDGRAWPKNGQIASIFEWASKPFTRHKMKTRQDSALLFFNILISSSRLTKLPSFSQIGGGQKQTKFDVTP